MITLIALVGAGVWVNILLTLLVVDIVRRWKR